ncbi:hypothetical protein MKZ38_002775 [Zalerion maritima]|uniref:Uncharacterized protein n=1 Tax=Zalerion maritima TaxID=339359 RepID=A0AAD5RNK4_9PEZI|nr:hypothetical protein MKZ38_002775 [Zalerion maritima]
MEFLSDAIQSSFDADEQTERLRVRYQLGQVPEEDGSALARVDGIFQLVTSFTSTIESEKTIDEARGMSTLTQLAFFFIPLTFVGNSAGKNLKVGFALAQAGTSSSYHHFHLGSHYHPRF